MIISDQDLLDKAKGITHLSGGDAVPQAIPQANANQIGGDHYAKRTIQPWDYIIANNIGFLEGNAIKYLTRWKEKGGVQDIEKAQHYIEKLLEVERAKK